MDVTIRNFSEIYDKFQSEIVDCDFVAIDCEFSGLFNQGKINELETYEDLYRKTRDSIRNFQILQVGLSLFSKDKICNDKFVCHSYNFNIFPSTSIFLPDGQKERHFLSQSSSLKFLVENGFDFNKVFRDGISYIPIELLKSTEEKIHTKVNENCTNYIQITSDEDKLFVAEHKEKIKKFIESDQQELILQQCNSYQRRIIYEIIEKSDYKDRVEVSTGKHKNKGQIIIKKSLMKTKDEVIRNLMIENVGFTLIIQSMIKHPKPVVGHCLFLDLLHIYNSFIETLPTDYKEFKMNLNCFFTTIYDLKLLCSDQSLKNFITQHSLTKIYETLKNEPFLKTEILLKNEDDISPKQYHQAGYDSYITGCCFIILIRYLCAQEFKKITDIFNNEILDRFKNKIAILGSYDIKHIDLMNDDPELKRDHIFHVKFPNFLHRKEINSIFSDYGGIGKIIWIDNQSAFCALKDENKSSEVIQALILNAKESNPFKVQQYSHYMEILNEKHNTTHQRNNSEINNPNDSLDSLDKNFSRSSKKIKLDLSAQNKLEAKTSSTQKLFDDELSWTIS